MSSGGRSTQPRWLLLAVALSLVGIVLAAQATPAARRVVFGAGGRSAAPTQGGPRPSAPSPAVRAGAGPRTGGSEAPVLAGVRIPDRTAAARASVGPRPSGDSPGLTSSPSGATTTTAPSASPTSTTAPVPATTTTTSVTTTTIGPIPTTTIDTTPVLAAPAQVQQGWLAGPDSISATYAVDGAVDVTASFSGASALDLEADCPSGTRSTSGSSPLGLPGLEAGCWLTLSGPSTMPTTTYSIELVPR
jgi:hypothetical protein